MSSMYGSGKMKNDRLKPFVHKVKGAKNLALFNILEGEFYHIQPTGTIEEFRTFLIKAGLLFESQAIVPFKTCVNVIKKEDMLFIRNIQICLNGNQEFTCWGKNSGIKKNPLEPGIVDVILKQLQDIPIQCLTIVAQYWEDENLWELVRGLIFQQLQLRIKEGCNEKEISRLREVVQHPDEITLNPVIDLEKLNTQVQAFFYHHDFNPCLGHQVAIDTNGEIKPCLWWPISLGNIIQDNIIDLIISGKFDRFWEISKDDIDDCKSCEYRYNCMDCRLDSSSRDLGHTKKPYFCHYNPLTGKGKKKS